MLDINDFDRYGINQYTKTKYNINGFDRYGFDRDGINQYIKDKYDINGFERDDFDINGFDRDVLIEMVLISILKTNMI